MKKPCDHYFVRQSLKHNLKVTDDCILKKVNKKSSVVLIISNSDG